MFCPQGNLVDRSEVSRNRILGTEWDLKEGGRVTLSGVPTKQERGPFANIRRKRRLKTPA